MSMYKSKSTKNESPSTINSTFSDNQQVTSSQSSFSDMVDKRYSYYDKNYLDKSYSHRFNEKLVINSQHDYSNDYENYKKEIEPQQNEKIEAKFEKLMALINKFNFYEINLLKSSWEEKIFFNEIRQKKSIRDFFQQEFFWELVYKDIYDQNIEIFEKLPNLKHQIIVFPRFINLLLSSMYYIELESNKKINKSLVNLYESFLNMITYYSKIGNLHKSSYINLNSSTSNISIDEIFQVVNETILKHLIFYFNDIRDHDISVELRQNWFNLLDLITFILLHFDDGSNTGYHSKSGSVTISVKQADDIDSPKKNKKKKSVFTKMFKKH